MASESGFDAPEGASSPQTDTELPSVTPTTPAEQAAPEHSETEQPETKAPETGQSGEKQPEKQSGETSDGAAEAAPRARRTRRAGTGRSRSKASAEAPADGQADEQAAETPQAGDAEAAEPGESAEQAEPVKPRRSRARASRTSKTAASATAASPADDGESAETSESAESAPSTGALAQAPEAETPEVVAGVLPAHQSDSVEQPEATADADSDLGADDTDGTGNTDGTEDTEELGDSSDTSAADAAEGGDEQAAPVAPPTFGLIFQAPDPAVAVRREPRRRFADADDDHADDNAARDDHDGGHGVDDHGHDDTDSHGDDSGGATHGDGADRSDDTQTGGRRSRRSRRTRAERMAEARSASSDSTSDDGDTDGGDSDGSDDTQDGDGDDSSASRRSRRRGGRGRRRSGGGDGQDSDDAQASSDAPDGDADSDDSSSDASDAGDATSDSDGDSGDDSSASRRRTRRRRRSGSSSDGRDGSDDPPGTVTRVREPRQRESSDTATGIRGSTRLEAKRQRRRDGREAGRRRTIITEAQFLARRESVERVMAIREIEGRTEIGVLEDGVLVEHYISGADGGSGGSSGATSVGNVYLGRVQNVLPSMEAAFVDIGKGRNAVLYAGEVNWDAAGLEANSQRRIENALTSGQSVLVQVTKDPIGHKGARLTSQVSLPGRFLVYVPDGSMTGISRKLPDTERSRLKALLKKIVPENAGVIVRTAAEGASEEELTADVERLARQWERIQKKATSGNAPVLLHGEPGLTVRVVRDVFNEDFSQLVVAGDAVWETVSDYVESVAPDLMSRFSKWTGEKDLFVHHRIDEQLAKAMDRKVWLPSGGSLVIDRTEAMTVIDVNTGKFTGSGGNLEETVTKNNLEAAEEIVNQLRLRDIGGIIVVDFIDMVLESNRDLVVRRLVECLGRDRTKHQVAEVTSLGLVQMTRKRVGSGLIEVFSEPCEHCNGRGIIVHDTPRIAAAPQENESNRRGRRNSGRDSGRDNGRDNGRDSGRRDNGRSDTRDTSRDNRDHRDHANGREETETEPERKAPSAAAMAAIAAAAKGNGNGGSEHAHTQGHTDEVLAPGSLEPSDVSEAIDAAIALASDEAATSEAHEAPAQTEPTPARRARRGGRRAASAPSGVELSSVGLMTAAETEAPASAPLTQVAGDASVSSTSASVSASEEAGQTAADSEAASQPASVSTSRRKPRRRAGAPAGPPTAADDE